MGSITTQIDSNTNNFIELKSNSKNAYVLNRDGVLKLRTENSNHLLLNDTGGGNVGIGTTDPGSALSVAGSGVSYERGGINMGIDSLTNAGLVLVAGSGGAQCYIDFNWEKVVNILLQMVEYYIILVGCFFILMTIPECV